MFIGRESELEDLAALWRRPGAHLVTCRGRRRIGKSTLFEEFAARSQARLVKLEGLAPQPRMRNDDQIRAFVEQLALQTDAVDAVPDSWLKAFKMLADAVPAAGRTVVLLDEISWMGGYDDNFPGMLKIAWDNWFKRRPKLVLVLCGSVSAWISDNILNNTGFVGRRAADILLEELPLPDCVRFWGRAASRLSVHDLLDVLSVTGGVPRYLEAIDPALSADENVRRLCFLPKGALVGEFEELFGSAFGERAELKKSVLRALATGAKSGKEIAAALGAGNNGHLADRLEELRVAGFLSEDAGNNPETGRPARLVRWRIRDNYTRFYLRCVEPHLEAIRKGLFAFTSLPLLPGWDAILGLQFESLVLANLPALLPRLGLGRQLILSAAPWRKPPARDGTGGCQVDLLLQTARASVLVEIKRQREIGADVVKEMEAKLESFPRIPGRSVRTALVYAGNLSPAVEADGIFDFVVDIRELLRDPVAPLPPLC